MNILSKGDNIVFKLGSIAYEYSTTLSPMEYDKAEVNIVDVLAFTLEMEIEELYEKLKHDSHENMLFLGYVDAFVSTDFKHSYDFYLSKYLVEKGIKK